MASAFNIEEVAPEEREEYLLEHFSSSTGDDALIEGYTFASWACFIESMRVLRLLSQKKSNLAARNEDGTTALTWAPNSEFTDFLVLKGAKVGDEAPTDGRLSMHRAAKNGLCDQLRTLIVEGNGAELLENFDEFGKTPLAVAASEGHLDAVKLLLESGADPNAYDEEL